MNNKPTTFTRMEINLASKITSAGMVDNKTLTRKLVRHSNAMGVNVRALLDCEGLINYRIN